MNCDKWKILFVLEISGNKILDYSNAVSLILEDEAWNIIQIFDIGKRKIFFFSSKEDLTLIRWFLFVDDLRIIL